MFDFCLKFAACLVGIMMLLYLYVWIFEDSMPHWCKITIFIICCILTALQLLFLCYVNNHPDEYI